MATFLRASVLLAVLSVAGCAFNRTDFVTGPDGKPVPAGVSDAGNAVGNVIRNRGPSYQLNF